MRLILSFILVLILLLQCNMPDHDNVIHRQKVDELDVNNEKCLPDFDSIKEVILGKEISFGNLTISCPKPWQVYKYADNVIASQFTFLDDSGYFRITKYPESLTASMVHSQLLEAIFKRAKRINVKPDCLDSLTMESGDWLINGQTALTFGDYPQYLTVMYVRSSGSIWQFFLLLPEDNTDYELGKYVLGQILSNSSYKGEFFIRGKDKVMSEEVICK